MSKKKKSKKTLIGCTVEPEMKSHLSRLVRENGIRQSDLIRMSLDKFLDDASKEPQLMMNLVLLTNHLQGLKDTIGDEDFTKAQMYINNIMSIKGGN